MADADQVPHAAAEDAIVEQLNPPAEGSLQYDDGKPLRWQQTFAMAEEGWEELGRGWRSGAKFGLLHSTQDSDVKT